MWRRSPQIKASCRTCRRSFFNRSRAGKYQYAVDNLVVKERVNSNDVTLFCRSITPGRGLPGRNRTRDLKVWNFALVPLSYRQMLPRGDKAAGAPHESARSLLAPPNALRRFGVAKSHYFFALQSGCVGVFLQSTAGLACCGSPGAAIASVLSPNPSAHTNAMMLFMTTSLEEIINWRTFAARYSSWMSREISLS